MKVEHVVNEHRFVARLGDDEAVLAYELSQDVLNILSVFVPEAFRGQGMADKLGLEAFDYALREGFKVLPTCPFIAGRFLEKHPELKKMTVK